MHGHPLKALASFGLEAVLPSLFVTAAFALPCHEEICSANYVAFYIATPIALSAGLAIDSAALAWEDAPPPRVRAARPSFGVSPLVLPPLRVGAALPSGLHAVFVNGFEVRVLRDWGKRVGHAAVHARFLRNVVLRLLQRDDVFRVLLGPGYPGHANHFHFDMATFRLVQIFEDGHLLQAPARP